MRVFVKRIVLFGLLVFLLATLLDVMISKGLRRADCYRYETIDDILKGGMEHEVLIMGNSRGFSHFNPAIIDSVCHTDSYNLGLGGYPINVQIAMYNGYKAHNAMPKVIVQEVSFPTLQFMKDVRHQHDSQRFFPAVYDKTMRSELQKLGYGFAELYIPLYRYFGYQKVIKDGLLEFLHMKHMVDRPSYKGFSPENGEWNGEEASKMNSIEGSLDHRAIFFFEQFLESCKNDNVYVVLVNSPLYAPTAVKVTNRDVLDAYYAEVAERYGFVYLNYSRDYELCNDSTNFCVSVHLNSEATNVFSCDFAHKLNEMGVLHNNLN